MFDDHHDTIIDLKQYHIPQIDGTLLSKSHRIRSYSITFRLSVLPDYHSVAEVLQCQHRKASTMSRTWFYLLIIVAVSIALTAVTLWSGPESTAKLQPPPPQQVVTARVEVIDFQPVRRLVGSLQPVRRSRLQFEVSGQVSGRHVEPGHKVAAGDVLLELERSDYEDAVTEAQAVLQQERTALDRDRGLLTLMEQQVQLQQNETERIAQLGRDSLASKSNYDSVRQTLLQLQSEATQLRYRISSATERIKQFEAAYSRAQRDLSRTRLKAPFAATVDAVAVEVGDYASSGEMAVRLVQLDQLDLVLDVPATAVGPLELGQTIAVLVNGREREGRIVALAADSDPLTHTFAGRVRLQAGDWRAGQLAEAKLPGRRYSDAHVVPATAILHSEGDTYVFTVNDGTLQRVAVKAQQRYRDWQVIEGVAPGTRIVARDVAALADGQEVTWQNGSP